MIRGKKADELDEHNQPTEPMPLIDPAAFDPTISHGPGHIVLPAPPSYGQSFSGQHAPGAGFQRPIQGGVYPMLPPAPAITRKGKPAGGAEVLPPGYAPGPAHSVRRSPVPALVGMCFVAVQLLLLLRFVLKIINPTTGLVWVSTVYRFSEPLVAPFRLLWQQLHLQIPPQILLSVEIYTLLAILGYGLVSRILVHLLKAIFNSR